MQILKVYLLYPEVWAVYESDQRKLDGPLQTQYFFFPAEEMWDSHYNLPAYMSSCSHVKWAFQSVSGKKETHSLSPSEKRKILMVGEREKKDTFCSQ